MKAKRESPDHNEGYKALIYKEFTSGDILFMLNIS
jgi:hypothetical protein